MPRTTPLLLRFRWVPNATTRVAQNVWRSITAVTGFQYVGMKTSNVLHTDLGTRVGLTLHTVYMIDILVVTRIHVIIQSRYWP